MNDDMTINVSNISSPMKKLGQEPLIEMIDSPTPKKTLVMRDKDGNIQTPTYNGLRGGETP